MKRFVALAVVVMTAPFLQGDGRSDVGNGEAPTFPLQQKTRQERPSTGSVNPTYELLDRVVNRFMDKIDAEAASLAVTMNGRLAHSRGYGWSDEKKAKPTQPDSTFRLASNSKPITAAVVKHLVRTGKLSAAEQVFKYVDIEPYNGKLGDERLEQITVQHLLDHKGGWDKSQAIDPMYRTSMIRSAMKLDADLTPTNVIEYMLAQQLQFDPGEKRVYANFGYIVLGRVIEKATSQTYLDAVQSLISKPLGVSDFGLSATEPEGRDPKEVSYVNERGLAMSHRDAAGGLTASAPSLCLFLQRYWISGDLRNRGEKRSYYFFGSLPDSTTALMEQRSDGTNYVVLFNARRNGQFNEDNDALRTAMNLAISSL